VKPSATLDEPLTLKSGRWVAVGFVLGVSLVAGTWLDANDRWLDRAFDAIAHLFYEVPVLAAIRRPSQLVLFRMHLAIGLIVATVGLLATPWLDRHGRGWCLAFLIAYAIRATIWTVGGNLPLVPGDSSHYVEVASSIARGEGPVKHYVESFFIDYPPIREGKGVLDDWATPLYSYLLAGSYKLLHVEPGESLEATVAVAKGLSFLCNLLTLPAIYFFVRRWYGRDVGLGVVALLAILPVHALYAGFELRESLVGLTSVLAIGSLVEVWNTSGRSRWAWAIAAGLFGGSAVLARNTAMVLLAVAGLYGLIAHGRRAWAPLILWGVVVVGVIAPWASATWSVYGSPFYTYTSFFEYTFSWTVHHYARGVPKASEFYTKANALEIVRVKVKSLAIIAMVSTMILGLPTILAFWQRLRQTASDVPLRSRDFDRLAFWLALGFVLATLAKIADITQVIQLGRYYLPLFLFMLPTAVAGMMDWLKTIAWPSRAKIWLAPMFVALLWSDPTWAYDFTWLVKPYQLHWPAIRESGDWIRTHPEIVPPDARIMTWFPWEVRLSSQRTTVLMPRAIGSNKYAYQRIEETIEQYGVTHILWGSFEPPSNLDPELFGPDVERLRTALGLVERVELHRSPMTLPFPVRLYRVPGRSR
jgi:4-amino-4-deoxy-L-arabinose transferase-like glycosyltransferase